MRAWSTSLKPLTLGPAVWPQNVAKHRNIHTICMTLIWTPESSITWLRYSSVHIHSLCVIYATGTASAFAPACACLTSFVPAPTGLGHNGDQYRNKSHNPRVRCCFSDIPKSYDNADICLQSSTKVHRSVQATANPTGWYSRSKHILHGSTFSQLYSYSRQYYIYNLA